MGHHGNGPSLELVTVKVIKVIEAAAVAAKQEGRKFCGMAVGTPGNNKMMFVIHNGMISALEVGQHVSKGSLAT